MSDAPCSVRLPLVPTVMEADPARRSLPELVGDLLGCLSQLKSRKSSARAKSLVSRYRDEEYNYLEVSLPDLEGVEADICVHGGCIYVRVPR